jgi:hypothetical protein
MRIPKNWDPDINILQIPAGCMGSVVGKGLHKLKEIGKSTNCRLCICNEEHALYIFSSSRSGVENARAMILEGIARKRCHDQVRQRYMSFPEFKWENAFPQHAGIVTSRDDVITQERAVFPILKAHFDTKVVQHSHEHAAGVLPVCIDPDSGISYFLLGLNYRNEYCHFHGWVEPGETVAMGAAREGFEESKGVLGTALNIWRSLMTQCFHIRHWHIYLVSLGYLNCEQREAMTSSFLAAEPSYRGMLEVQSISFIPTLQLRQACFGGSYPAPLQDGLTVREFLLYERCGFNDAEFWGHPLITRIVDFSEWPHIEGQEMKAMTELEELSHYEQDSLLSQMLTHVGAAHRA